MRIDSNGVDAWGIPALNFQCRYSDNEFNMAKDAADTLAEVCEGAGFEVLHRNPTMTILALSMRASEYLAEQLRAGNV